MKAAEARSDPNTESAIRTLMEDWAAAIAQKDVDAILEHYAEDVRVFDVPPPYETTGLVELRKRLEGGYQCSTARCGWNSETRISSPAARSPC